MIAAHSPSRLGLAALAAFATLITWTGGCKAPDASPSPSPTPDANPPPAVQPEPTTLQGRLEAYDKSWRASAPVDRVKLVDAAVVSIRAAGVAQHALKVGDHAPPLELTDTAGEMISTTELLKNGPVVLLWYRGGWNPYCVFTLRAYEEAWPEIYSHGATLLAISPQTLECSLNTQMLGRLEYPVLSDPGNRAAQKYGLAYELPPAAAKDVQASIQLDEFNGESSSGLPLTATYVIDCDGVIRYAFVDPDYRRRAEPAEVVDVLEKLAEHHPPE